MVFRIFFVNLGYWSSREGNTLEEAKRIAREAGFQATVYAGDDAVGTWDPISGFRYWDRTYAA